jgi:hypothetical protein
MLMILAEKHAHKMSPVELAHLHRAFKDQEK